VFQRKQEKQTILFNYLLITIMNKAELIEAMASGAKLTKADAGRALDAFLDATSKALKKGDKLTLVGFGTFSVNKRPARTGRNPKTGKAIKIAAKKVAKFKAGAALAKTVNK
jgi:DNA-binding protein HU-beta